MIGGGIFEDNVYKQLFDNDILFYGKRCLDIGTRNGLNCINLVRLGAKKVIGIDINDSAFHEMPLNDKITLLKTDLLDFDDEEKFDIITCFLWNMNIPQYTYIMLKIISLLKEHGILYIGIHDDEYKYAEFAGGGSVPKLLKKYFTRQRILDRTSVFQWIIQAQHIRIHTFNGTDTGLYN